MNFPLSYLPERSVKPRQSGVTMVMDKGLSLRETEDFIDGNGTYTDIVKLGFGSALITPRLKEKIELYKSAGIPVYFGGTLLEAFIVRDEVDNYLKLIDKYKIEHAEISDGSIVLDHNKKCDLIRQLSKYVTVISEVGSKEEGIIIHPARWIEMMNKEIEAGVWKVIAEARESGTVGIYRPNGKAHVMLINKIVSKVPVDKIIWETPIKSQQVYFIKLFGANVNLGNIAPTEVIALESLRLGLRSDTFFQFLPKELIPVS
ncbi:MAG: phosphosulfolactate synthase [Bacteroidetes bacterium]|nr:phosphosulfolactate synthase [Bacteroidota bacterium]MBK7389651.1 phosphosulfolactate synthase [Bacteroidota bacterium]MBK9048225.1 phosphosulfolactate synthase [Bacteroidota bacterium]MBK9425335.1 phosphosulfolactate synthase [Bacteroidota bacterium]MBL0072169.1 phosphosulfolactate synthase [Bacteroidota bacterium]